MSYISLVDNVVELLLDKNSSISDTLDKLEFLFATNPSRHPPNRKFARNKTRNFPAKLFFAKYVKRTIA